MEGRCALLRLPVDSKSRFLALCLSVSKTWDCGPLYGMLFFWFTAASLKLKVLLHALSKRQVSQIWHTALCLTQNGAPCRTWKCCPNAPGPCHCASQHVRQFMACAPPFRSIDASFALCRKQQCLPSTLRDSGVLHCFCFSPAF